MAFLELINVQKAFAQTMAVRAVDLQVARGEFVSFLGPSGCGKTTTLRMIAGFEHPTSGKIVMDGVEMTGKPPNQRNIGMVFQSYALFPNMTVASNIGFGLKVAGKSSTEIKTRVAEMLALIKLETLGNRYPYQLSGGQQQRVALARALAIRPQLLLLDEPLSALDAKIRVALRNEIRAIQRQLGITTIYVTHDQEEALSLSDRVVVMNEGRMEQIGTPFEIYNFPATSFIASFVGTLNTIPATVVDAAQGQLLVNGQVIDCDKPVSQAQAGAVVKLALRPEQLRFTGNPATENQLAGQVQEIAFLGAIVRIHIRVGETTLALDEFNHPHLTLPAIGAPVTIYFPRPACLVLA
ncbi:MAG: ABC transporter ATP-binding protein [Caldilineaceae bacterium]|nr:ABC transporter ATP-binding protein [Caldilineaceae bacterium]